MPTKDARFITALQLLALWSFSLAQPLYDLLARNPTYLTAHKLLGEPLQVFVFGVSLLIPLAVILPLVYGTRRGRVRAVALCALGSVLIWLFAARLVRMLLADEPALVGLGVSILLTAGISWFIWRKPAVRNVLTVAAAATLIFPVVFYINLPPGYVYESSPRADATLPITSERALPEVVFIVFDELSLTSLLDARQHVRADLFPNFAKLAANSSWYVQASTIAAGTRLAVPALLTGERPRPDSNPDTTSHPANLFTMLGGHYHFNVEEPITRLCSTHDCRGPPNWNLVISDTAVVIGHIVLPTSLTALLPPLDVQWAGFSRRDEDRIDDDRVTSLNEFIQRIGETQRPGLHFLHTLLPHVPYTLLPSGHRLFRHGPTSGHTLLNGADEFTSQDWAATESRFLYFWQLQYADQALGRIIEKLQDEEKYDRALIVVTADHGVRFVPGRSRREPDVDGFVDIAAIPLFIKYPGQLQGQRITVPVQSTGVVPLIVQQITGPDSGSEPPMAVAVQPQRRAILATDGWIALPDQLDLTTNESDLPAQLYPPIGLGAGPTAEPCIDPPALQLANERLYRETHPEHFLAAHVRFDSDRPLDPAKLVLRLNNRGFAVHQTGIKAYSSFVDPNEFRAGFNVLELIEVSDEAGCLLYSNSGDAA